MLKFTSNDSFEIKNRGKCYVINELLPKGIWNPQSLVNTTVLINDTEFTVKGVEKYAIAIAPNNPYRLKFSILV